MTATIPNDIIDRIEAALRYGEEVKRTAAETMEHAGKAIDAAIEAQTAAGKAIDAAIEAQTASQNVAEALLRLSQAAGIRPADEVDREVAAEEAARAVREAEAFKDGEHS